MSSSDKIRDLNNEIDNHEQRKKSKFNLDEFRIFPREEVEEETAVWSIDGVTVGTKGNFVLIKGRAKSKKTYFSGYVLSSALAANGSLSKIHVELPESGKNVLFFDTEQSRNHVVRVLNRVCDQAGIEIPDNLYAFGLRIMNWTERREFIEQALRDIPNVGLVFIDGAADLLTDFNNTQESNEVMQLLMTWSGKYDINIITVLHTNRGDSNATGHLGHFLEKKAETVMEIQVDPNDKRSSSVDCTHSRTEAFESFSLLIEQDGLLSVLDPSTLDITDDTSKRKWTPIFDMEAHEKAKLVKEIFKEHSARDGIQRTRLLYSIKNVLYALFNQEVGDTKVKALFYNLQEHKLIWQEKPQMPWMINMDRAEQLEATFDEIKPHQDESDDCPF